MAIVFLNVDEAEFRTDKKPLHKHMSLENALSTLNDQKLWFANPTIWKDPFESRFIQADYDNGGTLMRFPWEGRVYCACFTETAASEAYWFPYSQSQMGIEFKINRSELFNQLELLNGYDIYIGKVEYMKTSSIKGSISSIPFQAPYPDVGSNEFWARLLLLKRNAFKYEDEVRVILVKNSNDGNHPKGKSVKFKCENTTLIESVVLDPNIEKNTEKLLKDVFRNTYKFIDIKDVKGKTHHRVVKSQLYQEKERVMLNLCASRKKTRIP